MGGMGGVVVVVVVVADADADAGFGVPCAVSSAEDDDDDDILWWKWKRLNWGRLVKGAAATAAGNVDIGLALGVLLVEAGRVNDPEVANDNSGYL
mmetsp:Transcript_18930/g.28354  ORF Transcript_18930/g.28354 Transcript_18930/m.28354 type:complete len:95 (-) Transcript_18930:322-606(-)